MNCVARILVLAALLGSTPLFADEPPPDKKPSDGPSKAAPTLAPKAPEAPKYQVVATFVGKITKINLDDMKMTVDVQTIAPSSSGKKLTKKTIKEEIKIAPDVKVRAAKLPERFDEGNKLKPYTAEEKKTLKGDASLPGFAADLANLTVGQQVQVSMGVRKAAPGGAKAKVKDNDVIAEKPTAIMIVCTLEEPAAVKIETKSKKK